MGADPLAVAISMLSLVGDQPRLGWFSVRKEPKKNGRLLEGFTPAGRPVVVIEDVVTTGSSTIHAIRACQEAKMQVIMVLALVDREVGGISAIRDAVSHTCIVKVIYTLSQIRETRQSFQKMGLK